MLIDEIHDFIGRKGISGNRFGILFSGNNKLVRQLESGHVVTALRAEAIREFMRENENAILTPGTRLDGKNVVPMPCGNEAFKRMMEKGSERLLVAIWRAHPGIMRYRQKNGGRCIVPQIGVQW